jgi:hypothetical protein
MMQRTIGFWVMLMLAFASSGCSMLNTISSNAASLVGLGDTGTVITRRSYVRSSYAEVAADLLEVKRGETLDILDQAAAPNDEIWYRVRAHDDDNTEGWIEGRNLITQSVLEKSRQLAQEDQGIQAQAGAQLKADSNLRLSPELKPENIMFKLEEGSTFDVIGWKLTSKAQDAADVDDAPKSGSSSARKKGAQIEEGKEEKEKKDLDEVYDIWYKVRIDQSVSPAPAGWLFGRQVELAVPGDITHLQVGLRKFVTWQRLDEGFSLTASKDRDTAKEMKPGSWVILVRSNAAKATDGNEPDFDEILVMGYDKYDQNHYKVWRSAEVWGQLPLRVDGNGDNRSFVVRLKNAAGQFEEKRFVCYKDQRSGHLKVNAPPDVPKEEKN